jgi:murein DD-endopeptidase MepM/ murein hydrolase activator NlpD
MTAQSQSVNFCYTAAMKRILLLVPLLYATQVAAFSVTVVPTELTQGDVFQIRISDIPENARVQEVNFDGNLTPFYNSKESVRAIRGLPLSAKTGSRPVIVTLNTGETKTVFIDVKPRKKEVRSLPAIPQALGGNTTEGQKALAKTLKSENDSLNGLYTNKMPLWYRPFIYPVANPIVTDTFGYSREGSAITVTHRGTDFRAPTGTPIMAMNRGVIRVQKFFRNYGNAVIIDHGMGAMTLYMHMSKVVVKKGQLVERGKVIGYSGATGYATGPHLHLSVRILEAGVDPEKFMSLMGE